MSTESPQVGDISPDGQLRWDGVQWTLLARGHREPTSWTLPLRRTVAAYLAVWGIETIVTAALYLSVSTAERSLRAASPQMPADQVHSAAELSYAVALVVAAVVAVALLGLAAGSFIGWRWVFWVDLVVLALNSIGVLTNALALTSRATQTLPPAVIGLNLLLSVASLAVLVWLIVAAARFGPWAMRR
jgi:hypothetical protein